MTIGVEYGGLEPPLQKFYKGNFAEIFLNLIDHSPIRQTFEFENFLSHLERAS